MILTINEIKEKVAPIAKKYNLKEVYLFGSYARGEADDNSDIDFMINTEGSQINGYLDLANLQLDLEETFGISVDLVTQGQIIPDNKPYGNNRFVNRFNDDKELLYA